MFKHVLFEVPMSTLFKKFVQTQKLQAVTQEFLLLKLMKLKIPSKINNAFLKEKNINISKCNPRINLCVNMVATSGTIPGIPHVNDTSIYSIFLSVHYVIIIIITKSR